MPMSPVLHRDDGYAVLIHLWAAKDTSWRTRKAGRLIETGAESLLVGTASCRVFVEGLEELYARCQESGIVHPNGTLEESWYGPIEFAILDPDNNLVVFFGKEDAPDA